MNSDQADILDLLSGHTDDSTIERLAFECLMNGIADERVTSLLNVLAWRGAFDCFAIGGAGFQSDGRFAGRPQVRTRFRR